VKVPILAYHKVSNKFEWGINTVSIAAFISQMKYLFTHNYRTISLAQYLNNDYDKNAVRHPVIITFDDADESVYLHGYPVLHAYGFTATVFVVSDYVGKPNYWDANLGGIYSNHLSWEQISQLAESGWEIGSHTATHRDLLALSPQEVEAELLQSRRRIAARIGVPVYFLSYPFNRFDDSVAAIARRVGYRGGCALAARRNARGTPPEFRMLRYGVYKIDSPYWFRRKLAHSGIEQLKQRIISFAALGTVVYKKYRKQKNMLLF